MVESLVLEGETGLEDQGRAVALHFGEAWSFTSRS
jgi:hypothetical protein